MRAADYADSAFGAPHREPGNAWSFTYYLPRPIPREVPLAPGVIAALSDADAALGQLQGLGMLIHDPSALIGPYLRREALSSTRIEGTQASLSEVFQAELDDQLPNDDVLEVQRYLEATRLADTLSRELPLAQRLILQVHAALVRAVRGEERSPGEYRRTPVWVGGAGATPETAAFVPPLPEHLPPLLTDWERFVNDDGQGYPALIQAALMHYQFETIHPFLDGNGRIGRLLINLQLKNRGRLTQPLLYLSTYFERHRADYYRGLQGVRESGDIDTWFLFFLEAVRAQAGDAIDRSRRLVQTKDDYTREAVASRSNLPRLVDMIVRNPFVNVRAVENELSMTNQGARLLIRKAVDKGWLESIGTHGRGGREYWVAPAIFSIMEAPMDYATTEPPPGDRTRR